MKKKIHARGAAIKNYLRGEGLIQSWLARKMGVSRQYVSQILTRGDPVGRVARGRIMGALPEMTYDELFEGVKID